MNAAAPLPVAAPYLRAYPSDTVSQVLSMLARGTAGDWLLNKYPQAHAVRTDGALYTYVQDIRQSHMRSAASLSKVAYDSKLQVIATRWERIPAFHGYKVPSSRPSTSCALPVFSKRRPKTFCA